MIGVCAKRCRGCFPFFKLSGRPAGRVWATADSLTSTFPSLFRGSAVSRGNRYAQASVTDYDRAFMAVKKAW